MTCPFLKEAQVKYCATSAVRKFIPLPTAAGAVEKCTSADHAACQAYGSQPARQSVAGSCPYLRESLMQFCAAVPVTRFVPYSESPLSRCRNQGFRYCQQYVSMAQPERSAPEIDAIELPGWLEYAPNHMWLDVTGDGACHVGIDAFLSRALGTIDRITYVWLSGRHRPTVALTVGGTDLQLVFPNPFLLTKCNLYLRADPSPLATQPYTGGWLFEGVPDPETVKGLFRGPAASQWMDAEQGRMSEFLRQEHQGLAADGGLFTPGIARKLDRNRLLSLFHEFFSPYASGK